MGAAEFPEARESPEQRGTARDAGGADLTDPGAQTRQSEASVAATLPV